MSHILSSDPAMSRWYQGHLAPDLQLPSIVSKPALFLLNTDLSDGPGEHWCLAVILPNNSAEFFDSFGMSPEYYGFSSELLKHSKRIHFNQYPVQSDGSATCGHHCIFWGYHRSRGYSCKSIMNLYSASKRQSNDSMVFNFVNNKYGSIYALV